MKRTLLLTGDVNLVNVSDPRAPFARVTDARHNERNETYVSDPTQDKEAVEAITRRCEKVGTTLTISGSELIVGSCLGSTSG